MRLALLATCLMCFAAPAAAAAGTVSVRGSTVVYEAPPGEVNTVIVRCASASECFVSDTTAPVTDGTGCAASAAEHTCTGADLAAIELGLGDGDDSASQDPSAPSQLPVTADGGDGGDTISGGDAGDSLRGGPGPDTLTGLGGSDLIEGGSGADGVDAGPGDDSVRGGCGDDILSGGDDDDTISGNVVSGPGSVTRCVERGGPPEGDQDRLLGGAGNDGLFDEAGTNRFSGGDGNDNIRGRIRGANGGGRGRDRLIVSGSGEVREKDGFRDRIVCTGRKLRVRADRTLDTVGGTCPEALKRRGR
jgi:Ca2+-binding RTX toxin-like protein